MPTKEYSKNQGRAIVLERHIQDRIEKIRNSELKEDEKNRLLNLVMFEVHEICKLVP